MLLTTPSSIILSHWDVNSSGAQILDLSNVESSAMSQHSASAFLGDKTPGSKSQISDLSVCGGKAKVETRIIQTQIPTGFTCSCTYGGVTYFGSRSSGVVAFRQPNPVPEAVFLPGCGVSMLAAGPWGLAVGVNDRLLLYKNFVFGQPFFDRVVTREKSEILCGTFGPDADFAFGVEDGLAHYLDLEQQPIRYR